MREHPADLWLTTIQMRSAPMTPDGTPCGDKDRERLISLGRARFEEMRSASKRSGGGGGRSLAATPSRWEPITPFTPDGVPPLTRQSNLSTEGTPDAQAQGGRRLAFGPTAEEMLASAREELVHKAGAERKRLDLELRIAIDKGSMARQRAEKAE